MVVEPASVEPASIEPASATSATTATDDAAPLRRLFVAILPDPAWSAELLRTQKAIAPQLRKASRTAPTNFHLTLEFLGPCSPGEELEAREALLDAVGRHTPFDLTLGDVGAFAKRRGAILWRGIHAEKDAGSRETSGSREGAGSPEGAGSREAADSPGGSALRALQHDLLAALARQPTLGSRVDVAAPYVPHLTLFRQSRVAGASAGCDDPLDSLLATTNAGLSALGPEAFPTMRVTSVSLMWSHHPAPRGPLAYDAIATEPLRDRR